MLKFRGSNPTILIQHGNYITAYKNLSKVCVSKGDVLESGQVIGEVFTNKTNNKSDCIIHKSDYNIRLGRCLKTLLNIFFILV